MDAMAPLCNIDRKLIFLARSDIFKKKRIAGILYFLKILPIFRIRDGYSALKKNETIFLKTIDAIKADNGLVILPEGNHIPEHRLRPLKKGFARIAFKAEEENDFSLDLKIVPFGLHYSDYNKIRSDLTINFGEPIPVSSYYDSYRNSPAVAINQLSAELFNRIKPLMIHIDSEEHYELYDAMRVMYRKQVCQRSDLDGFRAEQKVISCVQLFEKNQNADFIGLNNCYQQLASKLDKAGFDKENFPPKTLSFINQVFNSGLMILGFPLFLYGLLNNLLPWIITQKLVSKVKDPTFFSSFRFVVSLVFFPVFYLIQSLVVLGISKLLLVSVVYALSLPFLAIIAWVYHLFVNRLFASWKVKRYKSKYPLEFAELVKLRAGLDKVMNEVLSA